MMQLRIWGVRGSGPETGPEYQEYGGNTSCITVHTKEQTVILDAGTGLGQFDRSMKGQMGSGRKRLDLLLSHPHMDYLLGLYACSMLFDPQMEFHIYGERSENKSLKELLCSIFSPPYWPVSLDQIPAHVLFHEITEGDTFILGKGIQVKTMRGLHPGNSILYRLDEVVEKEAASVVYGLDCELTDTMLPRLAEFSRNCSLLICDSCYTEAELAIRHGWGHGSIERSRKLRQMSGAKQALLTHYERTYQDAFLQEQEKLFMTQDPNCIFAREKMTVEL